MVVLAASLIGTQSFAAGFGENRYGFMVGATTSTVDVKNIDVNSVSLYHAGLTAQFPLGLGFSIQPSLLYQMKGMNLGDAASSTVSEIGKSFETKVGYVEVPVQFQWGPDLLLFRPYLLAEPFIGCRLNASAKGAEDNKAAKDAIKSAEYGLGLGAGIDIFGFQVSGKWFWNFGGIYGSDASSTINTIKNVTDGNNFHGFAISVALLF